jgi:hypothetical protein
MIFTGSIADYVPFERVSDEDMLRYKIFNNSRLSDTGCWLWTGPLGTGGYAVFNSRKVDQRAHRASYQLYKGPIPKGMKILHSCDTPSCVNPAHLRAGTQKENAADRQSRGRGHKLRGESVGTSKLTEIDVIDIRSSTIGQKALAEKYGVAPSHIWLIRAGKAWKHVGAQENVDGN